jgi:hypothetical protein
MRNGFPLTLAAAKARQKALDATRAKPVPKATAPEPKGKTNHHPIVGSGNQRAKKEMSR